MGGEKQMKRTRLRALIFLALCCDLGLFSKRIIAPIANIITGSLHIPGGIGTSFSLMFLVIAAMLIPRFGCATVMGAVQSVLAIAMGMVGSMGILTPIGYIVPGIIIDCVVYVSGKMHWEALTTAVLANMLAAAAAGFTANMIVFRLRGIPMLLYIAVALTSGAVCGALASNLAKRLSPIIKFETQKREENA